jgi:hypothetical protein
VDESKVMRISRQASPVPIMINEEQLENVEYFIYLGSLTSEARCTHEIKSRISMAKAASNNKETFYQ